MIEESHQVFTVDTCKAELPVTGYFIILLNGCSASQEIYIGQYIKKLLQVSMKNKFNLITKVIHVVVFVSSPWR